MLAWRCTRYALRRLNFQWDSVSGALIEDKVISRLCGAALLNSCLSVVEGYSWPEPS